MKQVFLLLLAVICIQAKDIAIDKSPEQIAQEIKEAEDQFARAKNMINPYYQGPLLTPGAGMCPPGVGNVQGYVFVNDNYAAFNADRHSVKLRSRQINLNSALYLTTGITNTMDGVIVIQGEGNWQFGQSGGGFGDVSAAVGWPILLQTIYLPAIKFNVGEVFPTGTYQRLHTNALNATGGGSYQTQFSIGTAKLVLWTTPHPVNLRWFFGYAIASTVAVRGVNVYGGGQDTRGTVRPGNVFSTDFGVEIALTQRCVFCTDFVYKAANKTTFHGTSTTPVGSSSNDNLSIAPGFEYSWNPNLGVLAGTWFSIYGRNSANFVSGIFSVSYSFP